MLLRSSGKKKKCSFDLLAEFQHFTLYISRLKKVTVLRIESCLKIESVDLGVIIMCVD